MAVEKMTENVEVVQTLSTYPNQEEGMSAEQLKAKFDQGPKALKEYLNNVLVPAVQGIQDAMDSGEQYGLDTTLSVPGRAADAAAVGQRFMNLKASDVGARPDTWLPTIAEIGAAPAGYGLGTYEPPSIGTDEQINAAIKNGWYRVSASTMNFGGYTDGNGALFVAAIRNDRVWQTMYFKNSNTIARRVCASGTWGEWELENPPMNLGVEYRTTKRYQGKPVYTACFSCGNLPASGTTETKWTPADGGIAHIFASYVTYGNNQGSVNGLGYKAYSHNFNEIRIENAGSGDWSGFTATALIEYWKE